MASFLEGGEIEGLSDGARGIIEALATKTDDVVGQSRVASPI